MSTERDALRGVASRLAPGFEGYGVYLSLITVDDADELAHAAAATDDDAFRWTFVPRTAADWRATIDGYNTTGRLVFVVRSDDEVVGTTGYYDLEFIFDRDDPDACEVGHTWYIPSVRGAAINPACKLLLLGHAFETWGAGRVALRTDARNAGSRAAMLKLGLTYEGVRRRHMLGADGTFRDSAYFSAVPEEWPAIRQGLLRRLA
ncbi:MAG: GNAT family protein [Acidimicrobiales bacterium]|nr:GNAT family protein [Acidimicrobiales bacterium]